MTRLFMQGTRLQQAEQMMTQVPDFSRREKGVAIIGNLRLNKKGLSCGLCSEQKRCRRNDAHCSILPQRMMSGAVSYQSLIKSTFQSRAPHPFMTRVEKNFKPTGNELFCDKPHQNRLESFLEQQYGKLANVSAEEAAIIYLLTANEDIYQRMKNSFFNESVVLNRMNLKGISSDSYALYQAARTIRFGKEYIQMEEMVDQSIVSNKVFRLIITAMMVVRYGTDILFMS